MINERYEIVKKIGEGRSSVFLAKDVDLLNKKIVIKILPSDKPTNEVEAFRKEYFILRRLNHPSITKVLELGTVNHISGKIKNQFPIDESSYFITQEYFEGNNLNELDIKSEDEIIQILTELCCVLYYLHQSNYVYFDLKLDNVLYNNETGQIRLIDFGLTKHLKTDNFDKIQGSLEYIAPEIILSKKTDQRADQYSLGILLYKLIYGKFPFSSDEKIKTFKMHLNTHPKFEESNYSKTLINVVKKLLEKEPSDRFENTLHILKKLNLPIDINKTKFFSNAKVYCNNVEIHQKINDHIKNTEESKVLIISGSKGSGQTTLLEEIYFEHDNAVFIENQSFVSEIGIWQFFIKKLFYNRFIYKSLGNTLLDTLLNLLNEKNLDLLEVTKTIFAKIAFRQSFILLLDDFNYYDEFTLEVFKEIIPILQVNNVKIVISESSDEPSKTDFIKHKDQIKLASFTKRELQYFINLSFSDDFPKNQMIDICSNYTNSLPGNINNLIKNLLLLEYISFKDGKAELIDNEDSYKLLYQSQSNIFKETYQILSKVEKEVTEVLSILDITISFNHLINLLDYSESEIRQSVENLIDKNILHLENFETNLRFTNNRFKQFVLENIKIYDFAKLANNIKEHYPGFNRLELGRLYELANNFESASSIYFEEIESGDKSSALSYLKDVYEKLLNVTKKDHLKEKYMLDYAKILFDLGKHRECFDITNNLPQSNSNVYNEINLLRGKCLIRLNKFQAGKDLINLYLDTVDEIEKHELILELATAEIDAKNFVKAEKNIKELIRKKNIKKETLGRAYNLLGLIEAQINKNIEVAYKLFNKSLNYSESTNQKQQTAGIAINLANVCVMLNKFEDANEYWDLALKINISNGNLNQQALIHLSKGIHYYRNFYLEEAESNYLEAVNIFKNLGNDFSCAACYSNLGEVYLLICEYDKAYESFNRAESLFRKLQVFDELGEVYLGLGKLYYYLNDNYQLKQIIRKYFELIKNNISVEKNKNNLDLLHILSDIIENRIEHIEDMLINIKNHFLKQGEQFKFAFVTQIFVKYLLAVDKAEQALIELKNPNFERVCSNNKYYDSLKEFLTGKISEESHKVNLKPSIVYYKNAYEILQKNSITELTWQILYSLSEAFYTRGNYYKCGIFVNYSQKLHEKIKNNISDELQKNKYLKHPDRELAIEKLKFFSEKCFYAT